jgi:hypothetical protein
LPGATVVIQNTDPLKGTISDSEGFFIILQVPVGRYNIDISYTGYKPVTIHNVLIGSGKEVVLKLSLVESLVEINEVVIKANNGRNETINSMSTVSARIFSVEETRRYAGGFDDSALMAASFAGVTTDNVANNAILSVFSNIAFQKIKIKRSFHLS